MCYHEEMKEDWPTTECFFVAGGWIEILHGNKRRCKSRGWIECRGWIELSYMEIIGDVRAMQLKILNMGFENCKPISMLQHMCNKHFLYTLFNGLVCWIGKNQIAWNDSC